MADNYSYHKFLLNKMIKIAITSDTIQSWTVQYIETVLNAGWDYVHLRFIESDKDEVGKVIESIPILHHKKLTLHNHFELADKYAVGGLHLNSRCKKLPVGFKGRVSCSCHSLTELSLAECYDYVMLSPVFDSISKQGYRGRFSDKELRMIKARNVIALGGITPDRIAELKQYNFSGFAMLGYLFQSKDIDELKYKLNVINIQI